MSTRLRIALLVFWVAIASIFALQTDVSTNLLDALPHDGALGQSVRDAQRFGLLDTTIIEIDGTGQPIENLHQAVDDLGERLSKYPDLFTPRYHIDSAALASVRTAAMDHRIALLPEDRFHELLSVPGMNHQLALARDRLAGPAGMFLAKSLPEDPLDFSGEITRSTSKFAQSGVDLIGGHFLDATHTRALIVLRANTPAMGTSKQSPFYTTLTRELEATKLPAQWLGAHRFAAEAQATIHQETQLAIGLGTALVGAVFLLFFRSLRPLAGTFPALLLGTVTAGLAAWTRSPIHAITLAFGGALASLGVDYWLHLYLHSIRDGVSPTFSGRLTQASRELKELLSAYGISVAATWTSFLMLASSEYPAVADLAWVGIGASFGAFLSVVLAGPLVFAMVARPGDRLPAIPLPHRIPGWLAIPTAIVVAIVAVGTLNVHFDGDPRAMDARLPDTAALEDELHLRWGDGGTNALVVADGASLDAALTALAPAIAALDYAPGLSIQTPTGLLPTSETISKKTDWIAVHRQELVDQFQQAADRNGFDSASLLPGFQSSLSTTAAPTPATWDPTPLGPVVSRWIAQTETGWSVAALLRAESDEALEYARYSIGLSGATVRFTSPADAASEGADRIQHELLTRSGIGMLLVLLYMILRFRRLPSIIAAATPTFVAVFGTLGTCAWLGIPLTPASGPALVLVIGLAFDQGIFLVEADRSGESSFRASQAAIVIALSNAFAGFVGLLSASHPAVWSVGFVVSVGIGFTAIGAFILTPALLAPSREITLRRWTRRLVAVALFGLICDQIITTAGQITPPPIQAVSGDLEVVSPTTRYFRDSWRTRLHGLWVARLQGDPVELGRANGELTGPLRDRTEHYMYGLFQEKIPNPFVRYGLIRGLPFLGHAVAEETPLRYREEIASYTQVGEDPLDWMATTYSRKLFMHALHDIGQAMVDTPLVVGGCTGFIAGDDWTTDGHWLLARNWDFDGGQPFDLDKAVIVVSPKDRIPYLHVAILGLSGAVSGVNREGIAIALQAATSDAPIQPGMPMIFIAREILETARSLDDVEQILDQHRGFVSEAILAVDGNKGEAAIFEVTPNDVTRLPIDNRRVQANHLFGPHKDDEMNVQRMAYGTTVARQQRMEELLEQGPVDRDQAIRFLRDRAGVGGVPLPYGHEAAINADIASHGVVIDATTRTISVSSWPNLSGEWVEFKLEDLLASDGRQAIPARVVAPRDNPTQTLRVHHARQLASDAKPLPAIEADRLLRRALELNPGHPALLLQRAKVLIDLNRQPEAIELLEQAKSTPPERRSDLEAIEKLLEHSR